MTFREAILLFFIGALLGLFIGVEAKQLLMDRFWQHEFSEMRAGMIRSFDTALPKWPSASAVVAEEEQNKRRKRG